MLYIILGIIAICLLFSLIKKVGKFLLIAAAIVICGSLGFYLIYYYGILLLKFIGITLGITISLGIFVWVYTEIKLSIDTRKYMNWINSMGVGLDCDAPVEKEAINNAVKKNDLVRLDSKCVATRAVCEQVKNRITAMELVKPINLKSIIQSVVSDYSGNGLESMLDYLCSNNLITIIRDLKSNKNGITPKLYSKLYNSFKKNGMATAEQFSAYLSEQSETRYLGLELTWISPSFLEMLLKKGDIKVINTTYGKTYQCKEITSTSNVIIEELEFDDD